MKRVKSRKRIMIVFISFLAIVIIMLLFVYKIRHLKNNIAVETIDSVEIVDLFSETYIELPSTIGGEYGFSATGITYDCDEDIFYIGNYGISSPGDRDLHPGILQFDRCFRECDRIIDLNGKEIDLQGVSYDTENHTIWYCDGKGVLEYNLDGKKIAGFSLGKYSIYKSNGICVDPRDQTLWILCQYKYLLHYDKKGNLLDKFECDYIGQDHIFIDE